MVIRRVPIAVVTEIKPKKEEKKESSTSSEPIVRRNNIIKEKLNAPARRLVPKSFMSKVDNELKEGTISVADYNGEIDILALDSKKEWMRSKGLDKVHTAGSPLYSQDLKGLHRDYKTVLEKYFVVADDSYSYVPGSKKVKQYTKKPEYQTTLVRATKKPETHKQSVQKTLRILQEEQDQYDQICSIDPRFHEITEANKKYQKRMQYLYTPDKEEKISKEVDHSIEKTNSVKVALFSDWYSIQKVPEALGGGTSRRFHAITNLPTYARKIMEKNEKKKTIQVDMQNGHWFFMAQSSKDEYLLRDYQNHDLYTLWGNDLGWDRERTKLASQIVLNNVDKKHSWDSLALLNYLSTKYREAMTYLKYEFIKKNISFGHFASKKEQELINSIYDRLPEETRLAIVNKHDGIDTLSIKAAKRFLSAVQKIEDDNPLLVPKFTITIEDKKSRGSLNKLVSIIEEHIKENEMKARLETPFVPSSQKQREEEEKATKNLDISFGSSPLDLFRFDSGKDIRKQLDDYFDF